MNSGETGGGGWPEIDGYIFDLDGTLYRGDIAVTGARETLAALRRAGRPVSFVSNNSTKSRSAVVQALDRIGIWAQEDEVVGTAWATPRFLRTNFPSAERVHVVGAKALRDEIVTFGYELTDRRADVVVVGLNRQLSYASLSVAVSALLAGAQLVATNRDRLLPVGDGFEPSAGAMVAAIEWAVGPGHGSRTVGKPEPFMTELALSKMGTLASRTIAVGDQVETDIVAAQRAGVVPVLLAARHTRRDRDSAAGYRVITSLESLLDTLPASSTSRDRPPAPHTS